MLHTPDDTIQIIINRNYTLFKDYTHSSIIYINNIPECDISNLYEGKKHTRDPNQMLTACNTP